MERPSAHLGLVRWRRGKPPKVLRRIGDDDPRTRGPLPVVLVSSGWLLTRSTNTGTPDAPQWAQGYGRISSRSARNMPPDPSPDARRHPPLTLMPHQEMTVHVLGDAFNIRGLGGRRTHRLNACRIEGQSRTHASGLPEKTLRKPSPRKRLRRTGRASTWGFL